LNQTIQTTGTNLSGTGLNYNTTLWNFTITPDSAGKVAVEFLADDSLSSRFAYINAMSISTVPEPSAGTLLGLGLFVLTLARAVRRR
jgi:MYXO-CTERM domain-containing protein